MNEQVDIMVYEQVYGSLSFWVQKEKLQNHATKLYGYENGIRS